MTSKITLEEALELVTFRQKLDGTWHVANVKGNCGAVEGNCGTVGGKVFNTINGRQWAYVETPEEKLRRLIKETGNLELIDAFNQLEGD